MRISILRIFMHPLCINKPYAILYRYNRVCVVYGKTGVDVVSKLGICLVLKNQGKHFAKWDR